jgi:peptidase E
MDDSESKIKFPEGAEEELEDLSKVLPVYLLADSQLLFWQKENGLYFFADEFLQLEVKVTKALYIGASNGDQMEFFELFKGAMENVNVFQCDFLTVDTALQEAKEKIQQAEFILLAGGDVNKGWQFLKALKPALEQAYYSGAMVVGISAGAVQLSALAWQHKNELCESDLYSVLGIVPCLVSVHEESSNWRLLKQVMRLTDGCFSGIAIPHGAGVAVEYNGRVTALKKTIYCLDYEDCIYQTPLRPDPQDLGQSLLDDDTGLDDDIGDEEE